MNLPPLTEVYGCIVAFWLLLTVLGAAVFNRLFTNQKKHEERVLVLQKFMKGLRKLAATAFWFTVLSTYGYGQAAQFELYIFTWSDKLSFGLILGTSSVLWTSLYFLRFKDRQEG